MHVYTVHVRRPVLDPSRDIQFVAEGFSLFALLLPVVWALWHRLWWLAAAFFAVDVAVAFVLSASAVTPLVAAIVSLGLAVLIGIYANDLRRYALSLAGFCEEAVVTGNSRAQAERRFFDGDRALAAEALR
jgi:hypothetical protein